MPAFVRATLRCNGYTPWRYDQSYRCPRPDEEVGATLRYALVGDPGRGVLEPEELPEGWEMSGDEVLCPDCLAVQRR